MKILTKDRYKEYDAFLRQSPKGHFMQSPMWAQVKNNWNYEVVLSEDAQGHIVGSLAVLIRKVPIFPATLMYAPRGPVCDVHNKEILQDLVEGAKQLAQKYKSYDLKIDPDICISDTEFINIAKELGFRVQAASKNFEGIQPRFVFRLDVAGKTEEEILMTFSSKTRYNIRVALKKGVTVTVGSREDLPVFHKIMVETGLRDKFVTRSLDYFERMYDALQDNCRLYLAYYEGKVVAGTVAILYGDKVWYLYGASANEARNVMPNYLLQYEMIKWAIENKCRIYDFRGVSGDLDENNPLYGLYRFKKGFNGTFTEFVGEIDYVMNPFMNFMVTKGEKIFRELRRRVYLLIKKQ